MHRQQGGWRLNEYFFTVGPAPELEVLEAVTDEEATGHPLQLSYRPVLLDRFPLLDNEGTRIENGISEFCFPSGLKLCRGMQMPKFFCFVLTDAEGDRMYGNCLTIYEQAPAAMQERLEAEIAEWEERKRRKEEEEAEARRKQLEQEQLAAKTATGAGGAGNSPRAEQGAVVPPDGATGEEGSSSHTSSGAADNPSATPDAGSSDGQAASAPTAASEAEEDKPPDTAGEVAPATADGSAPPAAPTVETEQPPPEPTPPQPIFAPKCLCLLSKWPFINSSRSWLMQLYRLSLSPSPLPLERYICNFLQEVPCPVPGKVEVQYTMLDQVIEYPAPPVDEPLSWSGLNCEPLFECLSLDNVLLVFNMVLLENQVLFHSSQLSLLTLCGEVLSNLLYPLTWCHVYIPVLPRQCLYIPTNSPVPFLLGLHSDVYRSIKAQVPDTVFVVDLDHNHITLAPALPLPPLPERRRVKLHKALKDHANLFETRDSSWAERCLKNLDDPFTQAGRPKDMSPLQAADGNHGHGGSAADWDMVRDAFLGFFAAVLKDYRKFMVYPTPENPKPKSIFRQAEFIASQPPEWTAFLLELCRTQAFQSFLDGRLAPDPDDPDVAHFDEAIDIKVNRSRFSLMTRRNTPHFRTGRGNTLSGHSELKTVVALQPDTSQLPSGSKDGSPALFTYTGFPSLTDRWYLPPRPVAEIMLADGMKRKGNKKKRHNILRFKSEEVPSDPATLVFSTFLMAFELTIGKELSDLNAQGAGSSRNLHGADKPPPPPSPPRHKPSSDSTDASATQPMATITTATQAHDEQQPPSDQSQPPPAPAQEEPASSSPAQAAEGAAAAAAPAPHVEVAPGEEGLPPPTVVVVKRSPPPKPPRLGAKMRRLSEDLKEERLHAANGKLAMAFDLLTRMKAQRVAPDEMVFRSLIDACGRLGNVDLAMKALGEMNAAGFMPDASVYSCLVAAFAMNDQKQGHAAYQASQTLAMLDWNKIRNAGREANGHMRPKSLNLKLDVKLGTTSKAFKDAFQAFRKMSTPSMPAMSTFWTTTSGTNSPASHSNHSNHSSSNNHSGSSSSQQPTPSSSSAATGGDDAQLSASATPRPDTDAPAPAPPGKQVVLMDQQPTVILSSSRSASADLGMELDEAALQDAMAADNHAHTAATPTTAGSTSSNSSSSSSSGGASTGDHHKEAGSARPVSVKRSASSMACNTAPIKYQVLYGESLLTMLFPDLVLDTDCETCPDCQAKLPASAIQSGWLPDPNNYTTQCPLCVAARASELLHSLPASTLSFGTTLSASVSGALMTSTPHTDHTPLATPRSAPLPSTASSSSVISDAGVGEPLAVSTSAATTRRSSLLATMSSSVGSGIPRPPPRRFVARFSVHCSDPNWVGSTGPGSLLWCEYLSPWVLRKEVQSIVLNDGIDTLTDPGFRTSSQASSTIFWNLVLWFREYCLPLTFLLQPSAQQNLTRQASSSSF